MIGQVSKVLRKATDHYFWFCPGCKEIHGVPVPRWTFDGNVDAPSFSPSVRHYELENKELGIPEKTTCHYWVKEGRLEFVGDSDHELAGKTVPMVELGPEYSDDNYGWPE